MKYDFEVSGEIGWGFGSMDYVASMLAKRGEKPCAVRIESLGGAVHHGFGIAQRFTDHGDVTAYIVGMCASAATIAAMGAKKICMERNAGFLIHKCSNIVWELGMMNADEIKETIKELKKQAEQQDSIDRIVMTMYANKCGKEPKALEKLMQEEKFLSAEEALAWGLVDEIFDSKEDAKKTMKQRASWEATAAAYHLPVDLPKQTVVQTITNTYYKTEDNMKKFFDSVLAFFGLEPMAECSEEQLDTVLASVEAKHKEMKDALEANATAMAEQEQVIGAQLATIAERDATIAENATVIEGHLATIAERDQTIADRDATIAELNAQIEALKAAPGAQIQEPAASAEPQNNGTSAMDLYNSVKDFI